MAREYRYVSGDGHLEISPEQWRHWVAPKYRHLAPRAIEMPDGSTGILAENSAIYLREEHSPGVDPADWDREKHVNLDEMPGGGPPEQRVREMDLDGIDAEILFPGSSTRMWDKISDKSAIPAIFYGYNEFLAKQYCAVAPDRLLAMGVMPTTGLVDAMAELEHCAKLGLKGIVLRSWPNGSTKLKPEDDRFWAAVTEMDMPVTVHGLPTPRGGEYLASRICIPFTSQDGVVASFLAVNGVFDRFPKLQVYLAESLICWVPAFFANMDVFFKKYRFQYEKAEGLKPLERMPSEIIKEHCLWGFMDDRFGLELLMLGYLPVENAIWETDFPHKPTEWPHSMEQIERIFAGVPEAQKRQLTAGNAIRYFHLDAAESTEMKAAAAHASA